MTWLLANWKLLAIGMALSVSHAFAWRSGGAGAREDLAAYKLQQTEQRLLADRAQRVEETRRQAAVDQEVRDAQAQRDAARADAAAADAAAGELRTARDRAVARARANTCPSATGAPEPTGDPIGVLAFVQERIDARAGLLAGVADDRGDAGGLCERITDRLQPAAALK